MPDLMAEGVGFEPTVGKTLHLISSQAHSTTLAPLREGGNYPGRIDGRQRKSWSPGQDLPFWAISILSFNYVGQLIVLIVFRFSPPN